MPPPGYTACTPGLRGCHPDRVAGIGVHVLGPVHVTIDGTPQPVVRLLERGLLARLAVAGDAGVRDDRLAADLWGDDHDGRHGRLRVLVSRVRGTIGPAAGALTRVSGGYALAADVPDLRAARAAALRLHAAARAADPDGVRGAATEALAQWRGPALVDVQVLPFAAAEAERLAGWQLELTVHRLQAEIELGAAAEIVTELTTLAAEHPLHEPLWRMAAIARYRCGRQADALATIATLRQALTTELGVDPAAETGELELRMLRQDPGLLPSRPAAAVVSAGRSGLVGRDGEVAQLRASLAEARIGVPSIVLVEGEAGIGKTRLLEELEPLAAAHDLAVRWGRCLPDDGAPAFWPWRRALRGVSELRDALVPGKAIDDLDPETRFGLFEDVGERLTTAARAAGCLVLVLDDLHWADHASLLLLGHVAGTVTEAPLLIAASFRTLELREAEAARAVIADLVRRRGVTRIELGGLATADVAAQLEQITGRPCDADTAAAVERRTAGNPLFVGEIGRMVAAAPDTDLTAIPSGVRDAIGRRIDAMPGERRSVLATAAVLSSDIDVALVGAVLDVAVDTVVGHLDEAIAAAVVVTGEQPGSYRFVHDLVRDCLRLTVNGGDRARTHLAAADHLQVAGGLDPNRIAHHLLDALPLGDRTRAVAAAAGAAEQAIDHLAFEEAARLFDRAATAATGIDTTPGRGDLLLGRARAQHLSHNVAAAMGSCEEAAAIATRTGDAEMLGRAALLLEDVSDPRWLRTVARWCRQALEQLPATDRPIVARLLAQQAIAQIWNDDSAAADRTSAAAMAMADRTGDPLAIRAALRARQLVRAGPDGTHERLRLGDRMLGLAGATGESAGLWGRLWRFDAFVQLGRVGEADAELDELEPVVATMRQPLARWHLLRCRAGLQAAQGRLAEASAGADAALRIVEKGDHRSAMFPSHVLRLSVALLSGADVDEPAVREVERYHPPPRVLTLLTAEWHATHGDRAEAERIYAELPRLDAIPLKPFMAIVYLAAHGSVAAMLGDVEGASHAYTRLLPYAELHGAAGAGAAGTRGSTHLPLGMTAAARRDIGTAITHLQAATDINTRSGLPAWAAIARCHLAEQLTRRAQAGDLAAAAEHRAAVAATADRIGMVWLRDRAR